MAKTLMNEAECYLLKHWEEARLLKESMANVEKKCAELLDRAVQTIQEAHPELNSSDISKHLGRIAIGRKSWPHKDNNKLPAGLWVWGLMPDQLIPEDAYEPATLIWIWKKFNIDLPAARAVLMAAARTFLSPEELQRTSPGDDEENELIWFDSPSKGELLDLLTDGDGQRFVERIVSQFDLMAQFVPALDQVFQECVKGTPS